MTQTSLPPGTHVTTDTPTPSAFLTGFALISRVASGAGAGAPGQLRPLVFIVLA